MKNETIEEIAEFFKLFANENRLKIIQSLERQALSVSEIEEKTNLSQSLVSQQLKNLKKSRIVTSEKAGKMRLYSLYDQHVLHLLADVADHLKEEK
jgi:DNA-binding transcriptional ArsR family regulator